MLPLYSMRYKFCVVSHIILVFCVSCNTEESKLISSSNYYLVKEMEFNNDSTVLETSIVTDNNINFFIQSESANCKRIYYMQDSIIAGPMWKYNNGELIYYHVVDINSDTVFACRYNNGIGDTLRNTMSLQMAMDFNMIAEDGLIVGYRNPYVPDCSSPILVSYIIDFETKDTLFPAEVLVNLGYTVYARYNIEGHRRFFIHGSVVKYNTKNEANFFHQGVFVEVVNNGTMLETIQRTYIREKIDTQFLKNNLLGNAIFYLPNPFSDSLLQYFWNRNGTSLNLPRKKLEQKG